jgi:hypothetical protein
MQSPKSRRAHAPGEKPASDNNPQPRTGGVGPSQNTGRKTDKVPTHSPQGHHGTPNKADYSPVPTHQAQPPRDGKAPGYVTDKGDAARKGGTTHRFPNGSE